MKTSLSEANIRFNPLSNTGDYYTNRWVESRELLTFEKLGNLIIKTLFYKLI